MALTQKAVAKNYFLDFFHLPADYPDRIATYPDTHLKKSEAVKTRICYSCMCSILSGTAFAVPTHGGSAFVCVWAARRWYVAMRKLKLIKEELTKRNIALRPFLHRDWMIPASVAIVAISIGLGVTTGIEGLVPVGHAGDNGYITLHDPTSGHGVQHVVEAGANHGADSNLSGLTSLDGTEHSIAPIHDATGAAAQHNMAQEWASGFRDQINSLFNSSHHAIAGVTSEGTYQSAVSFVTGANSALLMEKQMMALLGQSVVSMMCERLDAESLIPRRLQGVSCPRMPWAADNICCACDQPIQAGRFLHCCHCNYNDEELTMCLRCHEKQPFCDNPDHTPFEVQTALPGRFFLPQEGIKEMKAIAGPKSLACNSCGDKISRRWYYDCWDCRRRGRPWIQCLKCYKSGRTCVGDEMHSFYAFQRAIFASYDETTPYQKLGKAETGQATCSMCHELVSKGAYYHCSKCDKGHFDLCGQCFAGGEHCRNNGHTLKKYYAWKYKRPVPRELKAGWTCSNPQCQFDDRPIGDFFFGCREQDCKGGHYGVCTPCYFLDFLCLKPEHEMYKCVFK